jgi:predicted lipid-binding transport protein (Tim44 family)
MISKYSRVIGIALIAVASLAWMVEAEARRMGGGRSMGRQSNITQRDAAPAAPAAAPRGQQNAQNAAAAPGAAAANAGRSRWMAPLAGLAAGLGLAALASWLGFGEGLATIMLIALMVLAAVVVFRMLAARKQGAGPRPAFQGAYGNPGAGRDTGPGASRDTAMRYTPASQPGAAGSLPIAGGAHPAPAGIGSAGAAAPGLAAAGSSAAAATGTGIPEGFDVDGFLRNAKVQFVRLQAVYDAGNLNDLREFTTPEMFAELQVEVRERGGLENRTDVVTLEASMMGIETTDVDYAASVRFSGMIREEADGEAKPFDEVWVLTKPVAGAGGWVLAGIQQLN